MSKEDSQIIIRTAQQEDLHSLAEVLTCTFHPPEGFLFWMYPLLKLGVYEDLRYRLRSSVPYYKCLVAAIPVHKISGKTEEIVGTVEIAVRPHSCYANASNLHPYISNLAVSNSYRRQGIGGKLLLKCEQIAFEWGFQDLSLHVLENNYQARQLYLKNGYQLDKIEFGLIDWIFHSPRKFLLTKRRKITHKF